MTSGALFALVALRAVIELIVWIVVGRALLALLAGQAGKGNAVLRLFDTILQPPRSLIGKLWPGGGFAAREILLFFALLSLWLALGLGKWWLLR